MFKASVPLATATTCRAPVRALSSASSSATSGPLMKRPCASTAARRESITGCSRRYWATGSRRVTGGRDDEAFIRRAPAPATGPPASSERKQASSTVMTRSPSSAPLGGATPCGHGLDKCRALARQRFSVRNPYRARRHTGGSQRQLRAHGCHIIKHCRRKIPFHLETLHLGTATPRHGRPGAKTGRERQFDASARCRWNRRGGFRPGATDRRWHGAGAGKDHRNVMRCEFPDRMLPRRVGA